MRSGRQVDYVKLRGQNGGKIQSGGKSLLMWWQMVAKETIVHEEFGPSPVEVFCISVGSSV
jgi:hypothetical protein